jgi:hypothetical protein
MSNMSYCRFQNTLQDFCDCRNAMEDLMNDSRAQPLSRDELAAAKLLAEQAQYFLQVIADYAGQSVEEMLDNDSAQNAIEQANKDAANNECEDDFE